MSKVFLPTPSSDKAEGINRTKKQLVIAGPAHDIYDAVLLKEPNVMSEDRRIRTQECIDAVAEHMRFMAESLGGSVFEYSWEGLGTLTWANEGVKRNYEKG